MMPKTLVVVVAYKSASILNRCLSSLVTDGGLHQIVVVDNAGEAEVASLCAEFAALGHPVTLVSPGENLGFAAGCNLGVVRASPGWSHVFFVNPDVALSRSLTELAKTLDEHPIAIVAGLLKSPDHPDNVNARPRVTPAREFRKALVGSRAYDLHLAASPGDVVPVDQVDGALLGTTASVFARLGGFDTKFELYYEDVDLCLRSQELGGCAMVATEWGVHLGGASFAVSEKAFSLNRISRVRYLRKEISSNLYASSVAAVVACAEWIARSVTRQPEGARSRTRALMLQFKELAVAGSVHLLEP